MADARCLLLLFAVVSVVSAAPDPDDPHLQQRTTIHFMVSIGLAGPVIVRHLRDSFGPTAYHVSTIHWWIKRFKGGRTSVLCNKSTGRPTKLTPQKIAEIRALVQEDGNMSLKEMSRRSQLSVGTVHRCVRQKLKLKKRPARWVPHLLTDQQCLNRIDICRENLRLVRRRPGDLRRIVTGDESWFFAYDPASKRNTATWMETNAVRPQKVRLERSIQKMMLIIFFDAQGIIFRQFVPNGQGINGELYLDVMQRLRNAVR